MRLSREEIEHIAQLARLTLSPEELELYAAQLPQILDYVNKIQEAVTEDVAPTPALSGKKMTTREDAVTHLGGAQARDAQLSSSHARAGNFVKVPGVFDGNQK